MAVGDGLVYHMPMKNFLINDAKLTSRDWVIDTVVALLAFGFACAQMALSSSTIVFHDDTFRSMMGVATLSPQPAAYFTVALTTLPLVLRRRFPWPVLAFTLAVFIAAQEPLRGLSFSVVGPLIALFSIAEERPRNEFIAATCVVCLAIIFMPMGDRNEGVDLFMRIQNLAYAALAASAGFALRTYRRYLREADARAQAAERSREDEAAKRVEAERVRIAREIHDITAHSLSAVSIQAAAAERLIDRDPQEAKEAIRAVRSISKSALDEIRAMIGVLRNEETAQTDPTNGTDRMDDLVEYARKSGLSVECDCSSYHKDQVPAYADVALFGIAREAVTNVVRHAHASHLSLRLSNDESQALLSVIDDGCGSEGSDNGGHGIQGMSERSQVLGGTFSAAGRPQGGFAVEVSIPLTEREQHA